MFEQLIIYSVIVLFVCSEPFPDSYGTTTTVVWALNEDGRTPIVEESFDLRFTGQKEKRKTAIILEKANSSNCKKKEGDLMMTDVQKQLAIEIQEAAKCYEKNLHVKLLCKEYSMITGFLK